MIILIKLNFVLNKFHYKKEISNLVLFSLGKFVSLFYSAVYSFAMGLYVLKMTGSGLSFAVTLVLGMVPKIIIYPFAGVMADKLNKKMLVVLMDILNGVVLVGFYLFSVFYGLTLPMIYASTFIVTILTSVFDVSFEAAKPNVVTERMLMDINSVSSIIDSLSSILGSMIGGMVYGFIDIRLFIIINGLSFIFSGISEMFIDFNLNSQSEEKDKIRIKVDFLKDIREGFRYLIEHKMLINLFSIFMALNFFIGLSVSVPLPYIINNILKLSAADFGIIEGAFPAGVILGALFVKKISQKVSYNKILMSASLLVALCMIMIGIPVLLTSISFLNTFYLMYYILVMFILGTAISFIDIPIAYIMQNNIAETYRGRVMSMGISGVKMILPLAIILSGVMIHWIPAYILTTLGGGFFLGFIIISLRTKAGN